MERNIFLMKVFSFFRGFFILAAVVFPFFESKGLSLEQVLFVQAIFALSILLFEIPSGYFADRFGRTLSLRWGTLLGSMGAGIFSFGEGFMMIACGEFIMGIGVSLISGADSALLFDSLKTLRKENEFRNTKGEQQTLRGIGELIGSISGGLIAVISLSLLGSLNFIASLTLFVVTLFLKEPPLEKSSITFSLGELKQLFRGEVLNKPIIRGSILLGGVVMSSTLLGWWLIQPYEKAVGVPIAWYGFILVGYNLSLILFSATLERVIKVVGVRNLLVTAPILVALSYIVMGAYPGMIMLIFLLSFAFVRITYSLIIGDVIAQNCADEYRATVLSLQGFLTRGIFMIAGPLVGFFWERTHFGFVMIACGIVFGIVGYVLARRVCLHIK